MFPPFNWLSYGLLAPPEVDLELCICGVDLLGAPGMNLLLNRVVNSVITKTHPMLWPRTSTVRMHKTLPPEMEVMMLPVCDSPCLLPPSSLHPPSLARPLRRDPCPCGRRVDGPPSPAVPLL